MSGYRRDVLVKMLMDDAKQQIRDKDGSQNLNGKTPCNFVDMLIK